MSASRSQHIPTKQQPLLDAVAGRPLAVFVMGAPGVGKTTLCTELAASCAGRTFHGGQVLRDLARTAASPQTRISARRLIEQGAPIPVAMYRRLLVDFRAAGHVPTHFDGYPRDTVQFFAIPSILAAAGVPTAKVVGVHLTASADVLARRRAGRRVCSRCGTAWTAAGCCLGGTPRHRTDDLDPELVAHRQRLVDRHGAALLGRFQRWWTGFSVSAQQPVAVLTATVRQAVWNTVGSSDVHPLSE